MTKAGIKSLFYLNVLLLSVVSLIQSAPEKSVIQKLRDTIFPKIPDLCLVKNLTTDDLYLMKWLQANSMNVKATASKLMEHVEWRKKEKIDEPETLSTAEHEFPLLVGHKDKLDRPLAEIWLSEWDLRKAIVSGQRQLLRQRVRRMVEFQQRQLYEIRKQNENVTHAVLMMDYEGFNFISHACSRCIQEVAYWALEWETHYPNLYDKVYMINTTPAIQILIMTMKSTLRTSTLNTLHPIMQKRRWLSELDALIDRNERSERFGGNLKIDNLVIH